MNIQQLQDENKVISYEAIDILIARLENVEAALGITFKYRKNQTRSAYSEHIIEAVIAASGLPFEKINSLSRKREYVDARTMIAKLCKLYTNLSLNAIGAILGGRHHSTIISMLELHNSLMITRQKEYRSMFKEAENIFLKMRATAKTEIIHDYPHNAT